MDFADILAENWSRGIPLFSLLDEEDAAVLAGQVELRTFTARRRIYKTGDPGGRAYVVVSGTVRVTTVDEDGQEVVVLQPGPASHASMATLKTLSLILCGLVLQGSAAGAELAIHFTAIQKILAQLVFTQDGRKYLRGAPTVKCNYAYLENPLVGGDGGKLRVGARFSGRSALDVFGKCIGLGDSFEASITALPYYQDGVLRLKDVQVVGKGRDGFYIRRVCSALAESLRTQFKYRLLDDAKLILERKQDGTAYSQEVVRFHVPSVQVTSDAVVLTLDFALAVR